MQNTVLHKAESRYKGHSRLLRCNADRPHSLPNMLLNIDVNKLPNGEVSVAVCPAHPGSQFPLSPHNDLDESEGLI